MNRPLQVFLPNLLWLQKLHVNRRWESSPSERLAMVKELKRTLVKQFPDRYVSIHTHHRSEFCRDGTSSDQITALGSPSSLRAADEKYIDRILDSERIRLTFPKDIALNTFLFQDTIDLTSAEAKGMIKKIPASTYGPSSPPLVILSLSFPV